MSNEMWRIILAVAIGAHGIGHVLFLVPLLGIADWGQSTRSWLLSNLGGDVVTRIVGSLLWLAATVGFVTVAVGMFGQQEWWRGLAIGSAAGIKSAFKDSASLKQSGDFKPAGQAA